MLKNAIRLFFSMLTLFVISSSSLFGQNDEDPLSNTCPSPNSISFEAFNETSLKFEWDNVPMAIDYEINVYLNGNLIFNTLTSQTSVTVPLSTPFVDEDEFEITVQSVCPDGLPLSSNSINDNFPLTPIDFSTNTSPSLLDAAQEISPLPIYWLNNLVNPSPALTTIDSPLPNSTGLSSAIKKIITVEFTNEPIATVAIVYGFLGKSDCDSQCSDWARFGFFGNRFYSVSLFCENDILRISQAGEPNQCNTIGFSQKTSSDEALTNTVSFNPNPFKDYLVFEYKENETKTIELNIFDSMGQLVESLQMESVNSTYLLELSHLQSGLYHYQLLSNQSNLVQSGKLIKME